MNKVEEISSVVARHPFPSFVQDFHVRLGEFDGDPAVWVTFFTTVPSELDQSALMDVGQALARFRHEVFVDLMAHSVAPYPFFRFEDQADADGRH